MKTSFYRTEKDFVFIVDPAKAKAAVVWLQQNGCKLLTHRQWLIENLGYEPKPSAIDNEPVIDDNFPTYTLIYVREIPSTVMERLVAKFGQPISERDAISILKGLYVDYANSHN